MQMLALLLVVDSQQRQCRQTEKALWVGRPWSLEIGAASMIRPPAFCLFTRLLLLVRAYRFFTNDIAGDVMHLESRFFCYVR
jgi:hypothetical protein